MFLAAWGCGLLVDHWQLLARVWLVMAFRDWRIVCALMVYRFACVGMAIGLKCILIDGLSRKRPETDNSVSIKGRRGETNLTEDLIMFGIEVVELSGAIKTQIMTAGQYQHILRLSLTHRTYFLFSSRHE